MPLNVSSLDRVIRVLLGGALIAFALIGEQSWAWVGWIGVVPLLTAFVGFCPAYALLGLRTAPAPTDASDA